MNKNRQSEGPLPVRRGSLNNPSDFSFNTNINRSYEQVSIEIDSLVQDLADTRYGFSFEMALERWNRINKNLESIGAIKMQEIAQRSNEISYFVNATTKSRDLHPAQLLLAKVTFLRGAISIIYDEDERIDSLQSNSFEQIDPEKDIISAFCYASTNDLETVFSNWLKKKVMSKSPLKKRLANTVEEAKSEYEALSKG